MAHRSISQINLYQGCARKYKYKYLDKFPEKSSEHLVIGSAFDDAMTSIIENLNGAEVPSPESIRHAISLMKLKTQEYLSTSDINSELKQKSRNVIHHLSHLISPYFLEFLPNERVRQLADKSTVKLAPLAPVETQHKIEYQLPDIGLPIVGWIDMVAKNLKTGKLVVVDFKTSASVRMDYRRQVWTYAKALQEEYNLDYLPECEIHLFNKNTPLTKQKAKSLGVEGVPYQDVDDDLIANLYTDSVLKSKITMEDIEYSEAEYVAMREAFVDLEFSFKFNHWPKNRTSGLCSRMYCSFWDHCTSNSEVHRSLSSKRQIVASDSSSLPEPEDEEFQLDVSVAAPSVEHQRSNFLL